MRTSNKGNHANPNCDVCKGRGWYPVNGWPKICERCYPPTPKAKEKK